MYVINAIIKKCPINAIIKKCPTCGNEKITGFKRTKYRPLKSRKRSQQTNNKRVNASRKKMRPA